MMEIGDVNNVESFIDNALATKRRLMGMGHRIYKTYDPRAAQLNEHARIVAERSGNHRWYDIADALPDKQKLAAILREKFLMQYATSYE